MSSLGLLMNVLHESLLDGSSSMYFFLEDRGACFIVSWALARKLNGREMLTRLCIADI